jgi:DNA polymerase-1
MADKFLVIDGSSLIHRAFFALPPLMTKEGVPTGAVYGLCNMLLRLLKEVKPTWMLVAFDKSRKTFRTKMFADYKGQRKPTPPDLKSQFPLAIEVLQALNINAMELDDYEADDIIGTLATKSAGKAEVVIVTGDKDEFQLLNDYTSVYYTKRGISDLKIYTPEVFAEEYAGLKPVQLIDLKGLMGDASDNIPGVMGVGPKTALKLICQYGSVENVLAHIPEVKGKSLQTKLTEHKAEAELSKKLATICLEAPVNPDLAEYKLHGVPADAEALLHKLEFRNLYARFADILGTDGQSGATAAPAQEDAGGLFSLFGSEEKENTTVEEVATADKAEALLQPLAKAQDEVWFLTKTAGEIPQLHFTSVEILSNAKIYKLTEAAIPAFMTWLGTATCPKGTMDSKEVYRTAFCQKVTPVHITDDLALAAYLDDADSTSYDLAKLIEKYLVGELNADVTALPKVAAALKEQMEFKKLLPLYNDIEMPLVSVLAAMEIAGIKVDAKLMNDKDKEFAARLKLLESKAKEEAGDPDFNPQSPKQLGTILFEKLKLPVIKKTKTGYSTDVSVLEELADKHPLVKTILEYRILAKLYSTYLEGMKPLINKADGRIHTHFQQMVTVTGRLSSTDPNLQNIPTRTEIGRGIRELFVPGENYDWLMSCDYSQIELRILAHIAQDALLMDAFTKGQDVHLRTAAEVFGMPLNEVTLELRQRAKAVNFGIVYGISDFGLAKQIGSTRKEAAEFIAHYFARYTGVKKYMEQVVEEARQKGYVTTLLGRRRYLPDIRSSNFNRRNFAERTAINTPIQGTAADIMKLAMLDVDKALKEAKVQSRVLLQVHDELILEVTESEKEQVGKLVEDVMEQAFKLAIPLEAAVTFGRNWADTE